MWVPPWLLSLGIDLQEIMATSRDQKELLWAWQGWRDAVGRQLRITFERYVQLSNKAAKLNGEAPTPFPGQPSLCRWHRAQAAGGRAKLTLQRVKAVVGPRDGDPEPCSWGKQRCFIHHWSIDIA